jgi:hypothetical protein
VPPPGEKDADKARAETTEGASYKWRMVIAYDGTKFKGKTFGELMTAHG